MESNDTAELLRALDFAADKHRDQRRKGVDRAPYINHPIEVAGLLAGVGGIDDRAILMAAVLHDTIEDTTTTAAELREHFGARVCGYVEEVSDDGTLEKQERKRLQVEHAAGLSDGAKLIKLADKTCNVRDIVAKPPEGWDLARRLAYFDWAEAVVAGIRGVNGQLENAFDRSLSEARASLSA